MPISKSHSQDLGPGFTLGSVFFQSPNCPSLSVSVIKSVRCAPPSPLASGRVMNEQINFQRSQGGSGGWKWGNTLEKKIILRYPPYFYDHPWRFRWCLLPQQVYIVLTNTDTTDKSLHVQQCSKCSKNPYNVFKSVALR